ncbi:MAG: UTP--glucose-1-phosphate uridylyltransferase [Myxococcales bacterium]|nr:UTP--glucose-1-phosphate uridylyltransferase [Myxococcales bacterium]
MIAALCARLRQLGQPAMAGHLEALPPPHQATLAARLAALDLEHLPALVEPACSAPAPPPDAAGLEPPVAVPAAGGPDAARARALGADLLARGQVAAFVVAGGQGTRLGHDGPKGEFPATPLTERSLFAHFAAQLRASRARTGVAAPWYVMTSPDNDARTRAFFKENNHFGLDPADVFLFEQGELPTLDAAGRLLLADADRPATHPNGHGGALMALRDSGALDDLVRRGVRHLSYFQVDNPATRVLDPLFIGLHALPGVSSGEMAAKVVVKTDPAERVGVFGCRAGRLGVVEYSDLPADLARRRRADGGLAFSAANVAVHLLSVDFLARVTEDAEHLPLHRAVKVATVWDAARGLVDLPGAIKLERFVFDALGWAEAPLLLEVDRVEAFAPIKNADGVDSPATSRALLVERAARWLEAAGVAVPRRPDGAPDCTVEILPETAQDAGELAAAPGLPTAIARGARVVI